MKPIIDISFWQAPLRIDYDKLADQVDGVILRAAYGTSKDIHFDQHYAELSARGVTLGAYHYLIGSQSMSRQAVAFATFLDGKQLTLDTWMDVEDIRSGTRLYRNQVLEYAALVPDSGIYTSRSRWHEIMGGAYLTDRKLWVAHYTTASQPLMPVGFDSYWLWQHTSSGRLDGYAGNLDMNRFGGSEQEWLAWIGEEEEPEPEPEPPVEVEDKLFDAKVTTTPPNRLKTRYTPNGAERPKADWLQSQAIVPVYETHSTGWWRVAPEAWSSATWMERVEDKLPEPQEPLFQARVYSWATPYVNVRAEPSLSAGKVGFKYPLAVTDVMSVLPDWYGVPEGFMMSRFLERLDYDPPATMLAIKPLSQRDTRWASHKLGYSYYTIGGYGCLITAISMILNWYGKQTDPAQLNDALVRVGGFTGANLYWNAIAQVQPDVYLAKSIDCYYIPAPLHEIDALLADDVPVLVHVDFTPGGAVDQHWVLIVGKSGGDYIINDPWTGEQGSFRTRYGDPARWIFRIRAYRRAL
jgi:GH25 family lysozyme M1 (1,4-beta-N-acetylmuramidase)